jgi:hypothetical protein
MTRTQSLLFTPLLALAVAAGSGCGDDDDSGSQADRLGVGAECERDDDCPQSARDGGFSQRCLTQFKGGYCGLADCRDHDECPEGSGCVAHDDGNSYCFRLCRDKAECNLHRTPDAESNCSSSIEYEGTDVGKACVPPSGGD